MNMPSESQFVVSYKLIPEGEIPDQAFVITGTFSYAENERTKTLNIADREVDLDNFNGDELVAQTITPTVAPIVTAPIVTEPATAKPVEVVTEPEYVADNTSSDHDYNTENIDVTDNTTKDPNIYGVLTVAPPSGQDGVAYRVQIAAGHNLVGEKYFKKLNITDEVQIEIHDGWHKYTVGNFPMYRDARDYRVYIWNNSPIHDAFVAAYNSGLRITVQEALMIGNQKWYQ